MIRVILLGTIVCCLSLTLMGQTRNNQISVMEKELESIRLSQKVLDGKLQEFSGICLENEKNVQMMIQSDKVLLQHNEMLHGKMDSLKMLCLDLQLKQDSLYSVLKQFGELLDVGKHSIHVLQQCNDMFCERMDSLEKVCSILSRVQAENIVVVNSKIRDTNNAVESNRSVVEACTFWGIATVVAILVVLFVIFSYLFGRIRKGTSSIAEVRKAQDVLQSAHTKMLEESVKLDNKLMELLEKQMPLETVVAGDTDVDHSLALKVADEIVRIEMNLSRMDPSIKGYKQLLKAVQRIKDNFNANGYEIVDMLGKPYVSGMKAVATFVTDESLEAGQQLITRIIKPQINYQQQMIQAAQIEVSQPE